MGRLSGAFMVWYSWLKFGILFRWSSYMNWHCYWSWEHLIMMVVCAVLFPCPAISVAECWNLDSESVTVNGNECKPLIGGEVTESLSVIACNVSMFSLPPAWIWVGGKIWSCGFDHRGLCGWSDWLICWTISSAFEVSNDIALLMCGTWCLS